MWCHVWSEETTKRVTCEWPHLPSTEIGAYENMKVLLKKLLSMIRTIRLAEKCHNRIYHIIIHAYSWQKVTRSWPVMGFIQISHTSRHISKEEQVIDLILIRLISLHSNGLQEIFVHWPGFWISMLILWSLLIRFYFINICLTTGILVIKRRPQ